MLTGFPCMHAFYKTSYVHSCQLPCMLMRMNANVNDSQGDEGNPQDQIYPEGGGGGGRTS
jgi:hypothetical protein